MLSSSFNDDLFQLYSCKTDHLTIRFQTGGIILTKLEVYSGDLKYRNWPDIDWIVFKLYFSLTHVVVKKCKMVSVFT